MNKNTVYVLQKDLPFAKAGVDFIRENEDADYYNTNFASYHDRLHKSRVENNPEWFKPKEEVNESKPIEPIRHVYNSLEFETNDGEKLWLCMRDSGYEIKYKETWWEFKKGEVLARANKPSVSRIKSPYKDKNGNQIYSGDTVKGVNKHIGQSEVFFGYGVWQPFDYLNDYDGSNYEIVAPEKLSTANTEQFQWTNELVMEFVNFHDEQKGIHWLSEDIEKFKQSKSKKEEPQWEILSVFDDDKNPIYNPSKNIIDVTLKYNGERIHSVKRFPDNTVWSVDMVTEHGIITAFKIVGSTMVAEIKNNIFPYDYPLYLSELKAPKEEQVPIKVSHITSHDAINFRDKTVYSHAVWVSQPIPESKYQSIREAIEDILNYEKCWVFPLIPKMGYRIELDALDIDFIKDQPQSLKEIIKMLKDKVVKSQRWYLAAMVRDLEKLVDNANKYNDKKYTESELLQARRDAFNAAREMTSFEVESNIIPKYMRFEDYINSLNK